MSDIPRAMADAARTIGRARTLEDTLQAIVDTAALSVPGFTHVGISTVDRDGGVRTRAATDQLVWDLDALQYSLGQGPCLDSMRETVVTEAPDLAHDVRWPDYARRAEELGVRSQLAVQLYLDGTGTLGGLNLYSTTSAEIDPEAVSIADVFATHAALAFGQARKIDNYTQAMQTRELIGQATGLIMKEHGLDAEAGFAFLARTSNHANVRLRDIAARVVEMHTQSISEAAD